MSNTNNAVCSICGKPYKVCRTCSEQKTFKPWRTVTDTIEHYKIYMAVHGYTVSKNKEKAKNDLEKCDLSGLDNFNPEIKKVIKEIKENIAKPKAKKTVFKKDETDINE